MNQERAREMYDQYLTGVPMVDVARTFGVSVSRVSKIFQQHGYTTRPQGEWRRRSGSVLATINDTAIISFKSTWDHLDSRTKSAITESNVRNRLAMLGYDVWLPYIGQHVCDMGVLVGPRLVRIQVKAASYDPPSKRFRVMLQTRNGPLRHNVYRETDFDFFIVQCAGLEEYYVIPVAVGIRNHAVNMLPHRQRIINHSDAGTDWEVYHDAFHLLGSVSPPQIP